MTPSPRPWVGIVSGIDEKTGWYCLNLTYVRAIEHAGGSAIILPWTGDPLAGLNLVDGVLLAGGSDIDPTRYGPPDPRAESARPDRDAYEFELVRLAIKHDRPLLGICRGAQVLNVALGGSLYADLPTDLPDTDHPIQQVAEMEQVAHDVQIEPNTSLANLLGVARIEVNSGHHQAIRAVAPPLRVAGRSPDGVIEAVEAPGLRFVLGVQWHPEKRWPLDGASASLFSGFITATHRS